MRFFLKEAHAKSQGTHQGIQEQHPAHGDRAGQEHRNNRVYLTASANIPGTINSIRFQLKMGNFLPSPGLAKDWKELGEENFVIEVLDELKPVDDPAYDYRDDLKALEAMWMDKVKPFGERGYH